MDAVFLGWVVTGCTVVRAAVVPDDDVARAPPVAVLAVWLDHAAGQLLDQRVALVRFESLDPHDLSGIEVEPLAAGLGMGPDDRMEDRRSVVRHAAVRVNGLAGDEARVVGDQEQAGGGDLVHRPLTSQWNASGGRRSSLIPLGIGARGVDASGT